MRNLLCRQNLYGKDTEYAHQMQYLDAADAVLNKVACGLHIRTWSLYYYFLKDSLEKNEIKITDFNILSISDSDTTRSCEVEKLFLNIKIVSKR